MDNTVSLKSNLLTLHLTRTIFPFLDLTGELRNRIYALAFVLDDPIEFWPETRVFCWEHIAHQRNRKELSDLVSSHDLNLSFLRVCKQLNAEAAPIFYSKNEFRASGINGHMVAYAFVATIGRNARHLTHLTFAVPFWSQRWGVFNKYLRNVDSSVAAQQLEDDIPFLRPHPKAFSYDTDICELLDLLKKSDALKCLTLVLPDWFIYKKLGRNQAMIWEAMGNFVAAKPFVNYNVVRLTIHADLYDADIQERFIKRLRLQLGFRVVGMEWYSKDGKWKIERQIEDQEHDLLESVRTLFGEE
ncbi:hypothetical protein P154DRAFT_595045 [Amniculicola lignicola CBS 123094]|uniref:F-box domain-containing protein n=1 Tax=Amniculicola lignicola CBS 123094 TaxID=1392246 RepID=A0A6A5WWU9_9PLEO|nr:hypothetical protein P154DRAFT_595045 [Amniculicola lignicola CBS 123094]